MLDFDKPVNRVGSLSVKWDLRKRIYGSDELIPLWIADTDFAAPDEIIEALQKRLECPALGYGVVPFSLSRTFAGYLKRRHGWDVEARWIMNAPGVVPSLAMAICAFSKEGDRVMTTTPVYDPFYEIIEKNGRIVERASLKTDEFGVWRLDLEGMEKSFKDGVRMLLWCSPHNPTGRVWTLEELKAVGELCVKYGVLVLSDAIHSDIMIGDSKYIPFGKACPELLPQLITCFSTGKTFSVAGMKGALVVISDEKLRKGFMDYENRFHMSGMTSLAGSAMEAAYAYGDAYVDALNAYVTSNAHMVADFINERVDGMKTYVPEGTFLMLADCSYTGLKSWELLQYYIRNANTVFSRGAAYGPEIESCIRINIGTTKALLQQMLTNLEALNKR